MSFRINASIDDLRDYERNRGRSACDWKYREDSKFICNWTLFVTQKLNENEALYLRGDVGNHQGISGMFFKAYDPTSRNFIDVNWEKGIKLEKLENDQWSIPIALSVIGDIEKLVFKFLINDDINRFETGLEHCFFDFLMMTASNASSPQYFFPSSSCPRPSPSSETNEKKRELENYIGFFEIDEHGESLNRVFRAWGLKNHPDRGGDAELFKKVSDLRDVFTKFMNW